LEKLLDKNEKGKVEQQLETLPTGIARRFMLQDEIFNS
jgi:hypothetical protein